MKMRFFAKAQCSSFVFIFLLSALPIFAGDFTDVVIPSSEYVVRHQNSFDLLEMTGFGKTNEAGKPNLPSKIFALAIPPGAIFESIEVNAGRSVAIAEAANIKPAPGFRMIGDNPHQRDLRNEERYSQNFAEVYASDNPYPAQIAKFIRTAGFRKYNLVDVQVTPFQYLPLSKKLLYYPDISLRIHWRTPEMETPLIRDNQPRMEALARELILNYDQAQQWHPQMPPTRGLHDYIIITTAALESSVATLANWEATKSRTVSVVTVEWIASTYTGADTAQKMRNFLREKYPSEQWGIEDVFFVGHHSNVPMRSIDQDMGYGSPRSDFYFAELSLPDNQSWDSNSNGQYGEDSDDPDFYSEVNVGRIPWSNAATVQNICQKSIDYEMSDDASFKKNILLLGSYFWSDTDNAVLMDAKVDQPWMSDWTMTRMFEKNSECWSTHDCDYPLLQTNVVNYWSTGHYAFVNWAGHGSEVSAHIMGLGAPAFIEASDCSQLNDDYPAIIFADACSNSDTNYENIGAKMLQRGAVGFVGATSVAFGCPGWAAANDGSSQSLDYHFSTSCTSLEYSQGAALQRGMMLVYQSNGWDYPTYETCEWSLWGNPNLSMENAISSDGRIFMDHAVYKPGSPIAVTLKDLDLNLNSSVFETAAITMMTGCGDSETVTLVETGPATSVFAFSIASSASAASPGNGVLELAHGNTIQATYIDADDGQGGVNVEKMATATADAVAPNLTSVQIISITDDSALIKWTTDEAADSRITYGIGTPDQTASSSALVIEHFISIEGLAACTEYRFFVESSDEAGNIGRNDNGGANYSVMTYEIVTLMEVDMSVDPGWQASGGSWAWGHPTGGGGEHGSPDPANGYTGANVYGYNLAGDYTNNMPARNLTTTSINCLGRNNVIISFWRWLGVEQDVYDHASVQLSTNGSTWTTIWENGADSISDDEWTYVEYDVSEYASNQPTVYIRWVMGSTDSAWVFCGWNIDDFVVTSSAPCSGQPTSTPFQTATPTPSGTQNPTNTPIPTYTPIPTNTQIPTFTPPPPTDTPSAPPTDQPTDQPTSTATPAPPTSTPVCDELGVDIWMPSSYFHTGDVFSCKVTVCNPNPDALTDHPLFVILAIDSSFFFAPSFSDYDFYSEQYEHGLSEIIVLQDFTWPQNVAPMTGLAWYAALTDPDVTQIEGRMSQWTFGWGE